MRHPTTCKFCSAPLLLSIDDDYAKFRDPFGLIALACCDRCADLRDNRRRLEGIIQRVCIAFSQDPRPTDDLKAKTRDNLTVLTKKYAELVASWHNMSGSLWAEDFVDMLMEHPVKCWMIMYDYWSVFRKSQKIQDTP